MTPTASRIWPRAEAAVRRHAFRNAAELGAEMRGRQQIGLVPRRRHGPAQMVSRWVARTRSLARRQRDSIVLSSTVAGRVPAVHRRDRESAAEPTRYRSRIGGPSFAPGRAAPAASAGSVVTIFNRIGEAFQKFADDDVGLEVDGVGIGADERAAEDSPRPVRHIVSLQRLEQRQIDLVCSEMEASVICSCSRRWRNRAPKLSAMRDTSRARNKLAKDRIATANLREKTPRGSSPEGTISAQPLARRPRALRA